MTDSRVRRLRESRGWSQGALARRAEIPRATLSAIETGRCVPSVKIALSLSHALETSVESLFAPGETDATLLGDASSGQGLWVAEVEGRVFAYPTGVTRAGVIAPDGVMGADGQPDIDERAPKHDTLMLATCDPAASVLASAMRERGVRLIPLLRTSQQALQMLARGEVHAAGLHFSSGGRLKQNKIHARRSLGRAFALIGYADWDTGIVTSKPVNPLSLRALFAAKTRWVRRAEGAAARETFDRLARENLPEAQLGRYRKPAHIARDHHSVAEAVSTGFADAGVAVRLVASERGLSFVSVERALYDLCVPQSLMNDPRIRILREVLESSAYRRQLGALPGMGTERTGALYDAA